MSARRLPPHTDRIAVITKGDPVPLEIRLLGGFEARSGSEPVSGFESQRVRALLAYLAARPGRSFTREHLMGLLWPQEDPGSARHNLRQALYNLRRALSRALDGDDSPILGSHQSLRFEPSDRVWIDLQVFDSALDKGTSASPRSLARAAQVYRGDFLAGFSLDDSLPFEEWMLVEQNRIREAALGILRSLVEDHLQAGSYHQGLQYATKLLEADPTSEETYRQLMLLYTYSGRRSRALETYDELTKILREEMDVEPMEETVLLYRQLRDVESLPSPSSPGSNGDEAPGIPLVGREEHLEILDAHSRRARQGERVFSLITGPEGAGKTRLVRTFLDRLTTRTRALVMIGNAEEREVPLPYHPISEALNRALVGDPQLAAALAEAPSIDPFLPLLPLLPQLREIRPELRGTSAVPPTLKRLAEAVAALLKLAAHPAKPRLVVVFLDDLDLADADTLALLPFVLETTRELPVWWISTCRDSCPLLSSREGEETTEAGSTEREGEGEGEGDVARLFRALGPMADRLEVGHLEANDLRTLASWLVGREHGGELADLLSERTNGLPLEVAEWLNLLWERDLLVSSSGGWTLDPLEELPEVDQSTSLDQLIKVRIDELPTSVRRLLSLASVIGHRFAAPLLEKVDHEHAMVVEACLEVMLRRWLIRQDLRHWADSRRERDLVLWARGARRGHFEFSHPALRRAMVAQLPPDRARYLHRQVAEVLRVDDADELSDFAGVVAHHLLLGHAWEAALPLLDQAAEEASKRGALLSAAEIYRRGLAVLDRMEEEGLGEEAERAQLRRRWRRTLAEL